MTGTPAGCMTMRPHNLEAGAECLWMADRLYPGALHRNHLHSMRACSSICRMEVRSVSFQKGKLLPASKLRCLGQVG